MAAYELRISDWSSDVCSSDLGVSEPALVEAGVHAAGGDELVVAAALHDASRVHDDHQIGVLSGGEPVGDAHDRAARGEPVEGAGEDLLGLGVDRGGRLVEDEKRSEEHTSELQSLMRISYAG